MSWYLMNATEDNLKGIANAAAIGAHAKNKEERLAAVSAWHDALSKPRILP
jgi:hypothetical protein